MRIVTLLFPYMGDIAEFILEFDINEAKVDSVEQTLCASLGEEEIAAACIDYSAELREQPIPC